jgi:hypothetical protein
MSFENSLEDSVNKWAQPFSTKLLLPVLCLALWAPVLDKEISRALKLGMKETNYAG